MHPYDLPMIIAAVLAFIASSHIPRAWRWIIFGAASIIASRLYWAAELPHPSFVAAMCDALVCIAIDKWAREEWEQKLYRVFQAQVLVNLIFHVGIGTQFIHAISLEILNWTALGIIGGTSAMDWVRRHGSFSGSYWRDRVSGLVGRLRSARRAHSWWETAG